LQPTVDPMKFFHGPTQRRLTGLAGVQDRSVNVPE